MFSTHLYTNTPRHKTEISRTFILSSTVACVFVYVRTRSNGYTFSTDCEKVQLISRSTLPYQIATVEYSHENAFVSLSFPESSKSSSILQNNRLVSDNRISQTNVSVAHCAHCTRYIVKLSNISKKCNPMIGNSNDSATKIKRHQNLMRKRCIMTTTIASISTDTVRIHSLVSVSMSRSIDSAGSVFVSFSFVFGVYIRRMQILHYYLTVSVPHTHTHTSTTISNDRFSRIEN